MGKLWILSRLIIVMAVSAVPICTAISSALEPGIQVDAGSQILGTITAIEDRSLSLDSDSGTRLRIEIDDTTQILRVAPGVTSLASAIRIGLSDLTPGDRVIVTAKPLTDGGFDARAVKIIAMKQADIVEQKRAVQADWQRGIGGLVTITNYASGEIRLADGANTCLVHLRPATIVRCYDRKSLKYSDSKLCTLDQVHVGDQLRARGTWNPGRTEFDADEIVAGHFLNISATVVSVDASSQTATVRDLSSKRVVAIRITAGSQLRRLLPATAEALAADFKNSNKAKLPLENSAPQSANNGQTSGMPQQSGALAQALQQAPVTQLSSLHKGEAVMIVATADKTDEATAVIVMAGVEPILAASPSATRDIFSASWNISGSLPQGGGAQ